MTTSQLTNSASAAPPQAMSRYEFERQLQAIYMDRPGAGFVISDPNNSGDMINLYWPGDGDSVRKIYARLIKGSNPVKEYRLFVPRPALTSKEISQFIDELFPQGTFDFQAALRSFEARANKSMAPLETATA